MDHLDITSSKETIQAVEAFFKSPVLTSHRNMKLAGTYHAEGYSVAAIKPLMEGTKIPAEDIFWLGFYSGQAGK